jgi:MFS family permease
MLLDALTTAIFPWCQSAFTWHLVRLIGGVGTALSLVPMETLVNHNAPPDRRARDFGVYAFCVALGIALGAVTGLPLYPLMPRLAFGLGGLVTFLAVAVAWCAAPSRYVTEENDGYSGAFQWRTGALSFGTAWAQGFLEGGTLTFLTIYLLSLGHDESAVSVLMGGLFAGVILAQLPLAWLADRGGRLHVLLLCHALVLLGLVCVPFSRSSLILLGVWLFLLGACCGALYPLGLALLGERTPSSGLARANAWYLASNCAGSLLGPVLIGLAIDGFGQTAQFVAGALAIAAVLVAWRLLGVERTAPPQARGNDERRAA